MAYNSAALQQMRGQKLLDALTMAQGTFRQQEAYQAAVNDQYKRLDSLEEHKGNWSLIHAMKHPAKWTTIASAVLSVLIILLYFTAEDGDMLIPVLVVPFSVFGGILLLTALVHDAEKFLRKASKKLKNLAGVIGVIPFGIAILVMNFLGLGWLVVLPAPAGVYAALCWADIKWIHKKEHSQAQKQRFRKEDEEMALELSWRLNRLQTFCLSDAMQFAQALVPNAFQSSHEVGALLSIMKKYAVYDLHSAIQDYYQEQHMQRMEAEAAAARRAQEQAAAEQRAQTKILEWQRRDNQWHNREMEYQQQRQNETLNDMKRQQKEYNDRVKRFMDDMEPPFVDL